ncbi:amicyanin [Bosea sp. Root670]|uniref:cupredoxin domain-containing protein n=1 Tax=Bosea sp. Root670 TaxID=1736583 RepID=UPI00071537E1|nr:cupredoxin family copper-binding protein [Bosea sp. Root670]KRE01294.1 amicyanin [Bosea sp. Root670]
MGVARYLPAVAAVILAAAAVPARAETIQVIVDKLVFTPAEVSAKVGDTVEWVNRDILAHTATVKGGMEVMIPAKKTGRLTLQKAEAMEYYCRFHPNMRGRITVSAP